MSAIGWEILDVADIEALPPGRRRNVMQFVQDSHNRLAAMEDPHGVAEAMISLVVTTLVSCDDPLGAFEQMVDVVRDQLRFGNDPAQGHG